MRKQAEENYQRFLTTGQSEIKLNCALKGYFDLPLVSEKELEDYRHYLRLRIRPAAEKAVRMDDTEKLKALYELGGITEQQLLHLLEQAGADGHLSAFAWLLRLKKEQYGYQDRDFSL